MSGEIAEGRSADHGDGDDSTRRKQDGGYQDSEFAFPFRLYDLLEDAPKLGFDFIVSWVADGTAFKVHNRKLFEERILRSYFNQSRYKSFQRQLNFYHFERIGSGPAKGKETMRSFSSI